MPNEEDNLFETPFVGVGDFRFDEKVSEVFPDMIRRERPRLWTRNWLKRTHRQTLCPTQHYHL